jgi:transposase
VLAGTAALSDPLWQQIAPLLPPQKPPRGRPAVAHRRLLEGLLEGLLWIMIMHRGVPWREMPAT